VAQASRKYDLPATVKVALRVTDGVGLTSIASADLKISNAPLAGKQLGVTVNHGAQYTNSPDVTISAVFPATTNSMLFSNDGGFLAPAQFAPKADTAWKLDSSGPERLPKTVYVRFLSGPFVSETFTDDIILDETPPKVVNASLAQPPAAALAARAAAKRTYKLKVKATDNVSGVSGIQVTAKKKKPGKVLRYKSRMTVKLAARPRWVRVRDRAGNFSRWRALK
jgi:hypothetical protein